MKGAAIIYLLAGLLLLGLDARATLITGPRFGTLVFAVIGGALLVLARGLFLGRSQARHVTLFTSAFVTLGFGALAVWLVATEYPAFSKFGVPHEFWWLVGGQAGISLAFGLALLLLLLPTRAHPP